MAVKIRLKRMGSNKKPFYRLVVADARSPRDGRFIEEIGFYNPVSNPVELKMQLATFFVVAENKTINENATATILLPLAGLGYTCFIVAALNIFSGSLAASIRKKSIF